MFIDNNSYKVEMTDKGIIFTARDKDNKLLFITENEILNAIQGVFPSVVEYIQNKTHQKNKEDKELLEMTKSVIQKKYIEQEMITNEGPKKK